MRRWMWGIPRGMLVVLVMSLSFLSPRQVMADQKALQMPYIRYGPAEQKVVSVSDMKQKTVEQEKTGKNASEQEEEKNAQKEQMEKDVTGQLLEELDLEEVDGTGWEPEDLPKKLEFSDLVEAFVEKGTDGVDGGMICEYVFDVFFYELSAAKPLFTELLAVSLLFALFGRLLVTKQAYVSQLGFFAVYTGVLLLLLQSFSLIAGVVEDGVGKVVSFMTAFIPTYAATLFVSGNAVSAGAFYEMAFGLIYLLELGMKFLMLPGVNIFVLMLMMDHFFKETKLSKLAQLLEDGIRLLLNFGIAAVAGLGVVKSLIAPARDRLAASSVYHGFSTIPGIGNTFGGAGEILVGCGMMIKNSVGAAGLVFLCIICFAPLLKVFCFYVMYRVTAAVLWPFCDKRIAGCIHDVGRGCGIYLRIVVNIVLLFFITISMIGASTSFVY